MDSKAPNDSDKINLTGKDAMQFHTKEGTCKKCKGYWPILTNVELCQACILIYLPKSIRKKDVIVHNNYMKKGNEENACCVCYEPPIDKKVYHCDVCFEFTCIECVKGTKIVNYVRQCPICRTEFWTDI